VAEGKTVKASQAKAKQSKQAKDQTIAEIMAKKKAVTKKVPIQTDGEIADRIADLRQLFNAARDADRLSNEPDKAPAIQTQIDKLVEESQATVVTFTFRSIGRFNYDELVQQHPPTEAQKKLGGDFNPDTFPPALVSVACIKPEIPIEAAKEIFSSPDWNGAELLLMFNGALSVNTETGDIPLSRGASDGTLNSLLNLVTQQNTESLTQSISAGL